MGEVGRIMELVGRYRREGGQQPCCLSLQVRHSQFSALSLSLSLSLSLALFYLLVSFLDMAGIVSVVCP